MMSNHSFTEDQVAEMESRFGLRFPEAYRGVLLDYPLNKNSLELTGSIRQAMLEAGLPDEEVMEDLIENNEQLRINGTGWEFAWQDDFWWIGDDGSGGFFFLDCSDPESPVYYFDHEERVKDFTDKALLKPHSIKDYVASQLQAEAEWEADQQIMLDRISNRKWWQFWIPKKPPAWCK